MNIAFVTNRYASRNVGGANISSQLIVEGLRSRGHAVDVYALNGSGDQVTDQSERSYELISDDDDSGIFRKNISILKNLPDTSGYDIIHNYGPDQLPAVVYRSSAPIVATFTNFTWVCINPTQYLQNGCPKYTPTRAFKNAYAAGYRGAGLAFVPVAEQIGKRLTKNVDRITVQTGGMAHIMRQCGYERNEISIVPNLLDPRFETEPTDERNELIFVGRLSEEKGAIDVFNAFVSLIENENTDWKLSIYGDGPQRDKLQLLVDTQYPDRITIDRAPYTELPAVYQRAGAMIHAAKWPEPFSRTWLEAMASGTPIICSANPSSKDVLDGVAEFYDPFEPAEMRSAMATVLKDQKHREQMARDGRTRVQDFDRESVISKYISVYEQVLSTC